MHSTPKRSRKTTRDSQRLDVEIAMIRNLIERLALEAGQSDNLPDLVRVLNAISQASTRLAALLKDNRQLAEDQDLSGALQSAISEVAEELRQTTLLEP
ncbi:MAG: hypothetical protein HPY76_00935 [Anaerolineae bacterium]|nr:hypothetical protein [Anaerolineae bacterium]